MSNDKMRETLERIASLADCMKDSATAGRIAREAREALAQPAVAPSDDRLIWLRHAVESELRQVLGADGSVYQAVMALFGEALNAATKPEQQEHAKHCAKVSRLLTSDPPQTPPCDCGAEQQEAPEMTDEEIANIGVDHQYWFAARFGPAPNSFSNEEIRTHPDVQRQFVGFARAVIAADRAKRGVK